MGTARAIFKSVFKVMAHSILWLLYCFLVVVFLYDWLPKQGIESVDAMHVYTYSILYVVLFIVGVNVNIKLLLPKFYLKNKTLEFGVSLTFLILFLCLSKMLLDSYFFSLYLSDLNRPEWVLTIGHFFSFIPGLFIFIIVSSWLHIVKAHQETKQEFLKKEREFEDYKIQNDKNLPDKDLQTIHIKVDNKLIKLNTDDILFIEGLKQYVKVHTIGDCYITLDAIKNLEERLGNTNFIRVHKSYLVSKKATTSIGTSTIEIYSKTIPVGRTYKNDVMEWKNGLFKN